MTGDQGVSCSSSSENIGDGSRETGEIGETDPPSMLEENSVTLDEERDAITEGHRPRWGSGDALDGALEPYKLKPS